MDGVIVVDKPAGWTSHDVVNRFRRLAGTKKVGHLGTLDPMATGVLPLVVGRATRLAQFFLRADKVYEGRVRFGHSTDSYDIDGVPTSEDVPVTLDCDLIRRELLRFVGRISQIPPAISAKKIAGQPAYKLARKNVDFEMKPVEVDVYSIDLLDCAGTDARLRIHCGAGTYVRTIAHDLGQSLGCGAFLADLRRTECGGFDLAMARTLEVLGDLASAGQLSEALIPAAQLLPEFPCERVDASTAGFIRQGRDFRVSPFRVASGSRFVKAISHEGELVAIGEARLPNVYHPVLVL